MDWKNNKVWKALDRGMENAARFDYSRLVPTVRWDGYTDGTSYPSFAFGVESTWRYVGLGMGFGLGKYDFWIGWPKQ